MIDENIPLSNIVGLVLMEYPVGAAVCLQSNGNTRVFTDKKKKNINFSKVCVIKSVRNILILLNIFPSIIRNTALFIY